MKKGNWRLKFSISLILAAVSLYTFHYIAFRDAHHLFIFLVGELAFIPIEVLLVSLVIDKIIKEREMEALLEKLNLIIGVFFSEVGTTILKYCISIDSNVEKISDFLIIKPEWEEKDYKEAIERYKNYNCEINFKEEDLEKMKKFLLEKRSFLLKLLQNPNLLEHETFTHLITAVFHLEDELSSRDLIKLSKEDKEHLVIDIKRVYHAIVCQWLLYMNHLKNAFPYLFVTAMGKNPFINGAKEEVDENIKIAN